MNFSERRNLIRWIIILGSFNILVLILWNTYTFFQKFKDEERLKMELWATATKTLNNADENTEVELPFQILSNNTTIPIIQTTDKDSIINMVNVDKEIVADAAKSKVFLNKLKSENLPIIIELGGYNQYLYYGNSSLLTKLKFYPVALVLIGLFFSGMIFNFYRASKMATQNRLWAGMAKETAHQIGTPLSSLIGWLEIMKADNVDETTIAEIEKDINRLQTITDRFSKIGSEPVLGDYDLVKETEQSFEYLQSRTSKQVEFSFLAPEYPIHIMLNPVLHSWTIENLVKNAIDAMKGKGKLAIVIEDTERFVKIKVTDTGSGIPKKQFNSVFEPGFTTKKRGWGLGLSLTKRIVEEYHNGRIKVAHSEIGKGTTMQVTFKKEKATA
ncbi:MULTISPECIES: HAMP domain-containing sensor histidine kinase [Flavobacterium]|uniref:sensor histidine kinase n=1 Tax=Flavobacterium TaxID=237 RepID=UPI0008699681|nr:MULTISPECIES: HAMP domain-containing sensor histidine kinase [Flavobacterium]MBN9285240.1 HAMP domain-containing histidine kinase [Flavobacterium sp.]ODS86758.1 MAG: two-component sensor histidine kinase [Chryseobacterium sp. SCN 40-13]OJV72042.1 MAG: two-component sensor histidine kinase [Flavobacterium sp. 40-81]